MKNISYVINGVLVVAVVILFVLVLGMNKSGNQTDKALETGDAQEGAEARLPMAYVNVDSLLSSYEFAKVSGDRLMNKFQSSNNTVAQKQKQLEKEATDFERKLQNNAFLSQEKAQQEQQRIQKLGMDLQQMTQRMQNELAREEQKINEQIADSVKLCLEIYNATAGYDIIFSNKGMDNVLTSKPKYDITGAIIELLNTRYKASK